MTSASLGVRIRTADGVQGEKSLPSSTTVKSLLNLLFDGTFEMSSGTSESGSSNILHLVPKCLMWKGKDICATPLATLASIRYEEQGVIEFIPFDSAESLALELMNRTVALDNKLCQQRRFGQGFAHTSVRKAEDAQSRQVQAATGDTFEAYVEALRDPTTSTAVPLKILQAITDKKEGNEEPPSGKFLQCAFPSGGDEKNNDENADGDTSQDVLAIVPACCLGRFEVVKALLKKYPDRANFSCDSKGRTALHYAVMFCGIDMVRLLVKVGRARACEFDEDQISPKLLAAQEGRTDALQLMTEAENISGDVSSSNGESDTQDEDEDNLLGVCFEEDAVADKKKPHVNGCGQGVLHLAAASGHPDTVEYLLPLPHTDIKQTDDEGNNALHTAAALGYYGVVKSLLNWKRGSDQGFDVNAQNNKGLTALHLAASNGCNDVVRLLCEHGWRCDIALKDDSDRYPADLAADNGHVEVVGTLLEIMEKTEAAPGVENAYEESLAAEEQRKARAAKALARKAQEEAAAPQ